jgi:hypothetical protein
MEWKQYWRNVVKRYQVIIEGWPADIPFCNLSETSSALPDLEKLLRKWRCGKIYWRKLSGAELDRLDLERDTQIENGEIAAPAPRRRCSDYGKKRPHMKDGTDISRVERDIDDSGEEDRPPATDKRHSRKHRKSRKVVADSETDSSEENQPTTTPGTSTSRPSRHSPAVEPLLPTATVSPEPVNAVGLVTTTTTSPVLENPENPTASQGLATAATATSPVPKNPENPAVAATAAVTSSVLDNSVAAPSTSETSIPTTIAAPSIAHVPTLQLYPIPQPIPFDLALIDPALH